MKKRSMWNVLAQGYTAATGLALMLVCGTTAHAQLDPDAYTSLGTLTANSGDTVAINTTTGTITIGATTFNGVTQTQTGAGSISVFDFSNINIASGATITVTGTSALALLSQGNTSILATIDASGTAGGIPLGNTTGGTGILGGGNGGAGNANSGVPASNGVSTFNSNGGKAVPTPDPNAFPPDQDGSGAGNGGPGGTGGANGGGAAAGNATGVSPLTKLVGGGGGGGGPFVNGTNTGPEPGSGGGAGGGAIEIIAVGNVTVSSLTSNGGRGGGIFPVDGGLQYGGGGAGGSIVVGGATLTVNNAITANGGRAVTGTGAGAGGGGAVGLIGTPSWVLGSTDALTGLGVNVSVNRGVGGSADGTAGTIDAHTLGVTAPAGQTAIWNGTNFTNVIPVQTQTPTTPAITVTLGNNLVLNGGALQFTGTNQTFGPSNTFRVDSPSTIDTQAFNETVSSQITGTGGLFKDGTGTLTLPTANTFQGGLEIHAGTVVVANSGALGTGGFTNFGGTLQTGGGNHLVTVGGDFDISAGGTLVININGAPGDASNDQVNDTGGQAHLDGNLTLNYHAGPIPVGATVTYTIVTTSGGVASVGAGFTNPVTHSGALIITATGMTVGNDFDVTFTSSQGLFGTIAGLTPNQHSTSSYLDRVIASPNAGPSQPLINNLDAISANTAALGAALDQLTPLAFARFASSTSFNDSDFLVEQMDNYFANHRSAHGTFVGSAGGIDYSGLTVNDPETAVGLQQVSSRLLAWNPAPSTGLLSDSSQSVLGGIDMKDMKAMHPVEAANLWNVFVAGDAILAQNFSDDFVGTTHGDSTAGEIRVGADYAIAPNLIVGALINFGHTDSTIDSQRSKATLDSYTPGIYASYVKDGWYGNAIGTYSYNSYTQGRNVDIGTFNGRADSATSGNQYLGDLDGGYDFHSGALTFGPTLGVKYIHLDVDGYSETGLPGASLAVDRDEADSLRSRLGGRISYVIHHGDLSFVPHLDASWVHEFLDSSRGLGSQFTGVGAGEFVVHTGTPSRESALVTLGMDAQVDKTFTVFTNYTVQAGQDDYFGQSIQAGVKIGF